MNEGAERPAPATVRPEQPSDYERIATVVREAFGSGAEVTLVERIRASDRYVPDLALVAEVDGEIVGPSAPHGLMLPLPQWAPPETGQLRRLTSWRPRRRDESSTRRHSTT